MDREKQIEEIAIVLSDGDCKKCDCDANGKFNCILLYLAELLYNAGYRKQKQGKWLVTERGCVITCSNCKERVELYYPDGTEVGPALTYCPYCGSKNKEN